jgi:8-amino-3,8-dideoxy-alpha-D-manno-octulosonate transaminase
MPGYEWMGDEERRQVNEVLDTGVLFRYEFGEERKGVYKVKQFEEAFARYNGAGYAHAVSSGTAALKVALAVLGVGPGDEVITQGFTFVATFEAIIESGAAPIAAEIDYTLNLDPEDFKRKITDKTKAVIPVHMLGSPARIQSIVEIAGRHNIKVIEDNAQAVGGSVAGRKLGAWGDMGTFSFDFYKILTTGEGGMVVTNDRDVYIKAAEYSDHGHDHNPDVHRALEGRTYLGFNYRMGEFQGALGLAQLRKLDAMIERQRQNQVMLRETLERFDGIKMRELPENGHEIYTHLCFFLPDAQRAQAFHRGLTERKVPAVYFRNNLWHYLPNWEHLLNKKTMWPGPHPFGGPIYGREVRYSADMLPSSDAVLEKLVVIPISLEMDGEKIRSIVAQLEVVAESVL